MSEYQRTVTQAYGAIAASNFVDAHVSAAVKELGRQMDLLNGVLGGTDAGSAARAKYMGAMRKLQEAASLTGSAVGDIQKAAETLAAL